MAFKINKYVDQTFAVDIQNASGDLIETVVLMGISTRKWDDLGLMVETEEAQPVKDPKTLEFIKDIKTQRKLDAKAELMRNAIRIVWALENGEGIEWGALNPGDNLHAKAELLVSQVGVDTFNALINALQLWAFGKKVSRVDEAKRFQSVSGNSHADLRAAKDPNLSVVDTA